MMDSPEKRSALRILVDAVVGNVAIDSPEVGAVFERFRVQGSERAAFTADVRRHQGELSRLQRRERELGVLFSSARELAELRDIDALLGRLVSRAHEMMGTDVTYLSVRSGDAGTERPQDRRLGDAAVPPPTGDAVGARVAQR